MNRYVVKNHKEWKVVNAGYKRSIKNFPTQAAAIEFARGLLGTTSLMVQGRDNKFIRHYNEKQTDGEEILSCEIPKYVMKHSDEYEKFMQEYKWRMLSTVGIILLFIGLAFMVLWLIARSR